MGGFSLLVASAGSLLSGGAGPDKCREHVIYSKADDGESFEAQAAACARRLEKKPENHDKYCREVTVRGSSIRVMRDSSRVMCFRYCDPVKRIK